MPRDWERHYQADAGPVEPAFVVRYFGGRLPPGPVLDLAGGAGRNALFLAALGHPVVLLEKSRAALLRARQAAERAGAEIYALPADLEDDAEPLPPGRFAGR